MNQSKVSTFVFAFASLAGILCVSKTDGQVYGFPPELATTPVFPDPVFGQPADLDHSRPGWQFLVHGAKPQPGGSNYPAGSDHGVPHSYLQFPNRYYRWAGRQHLVHRAYREQDLAARTA